MPNPKVRVDIPSNPSDRLNLAARVNAKHLADGANSPLNAILNHKWEINGPQVVIAQTHHNDAEDLQRRANLEYRKRDLLLDEIDESIKSSRDLLLGIYRDNPKELSNWGFDVSDSPKAAPKKV
ncbi:MAG: hypothetical protein ACYC25_04460 [Paludibacter sp.]